MALIFYMIKDLNSWQTNQRNEALRKRKALNRRSRNRGSLVGKMR